MSTVPRILVPLRIEAAAVRFGARRAPIELVGMGPVRATAARARIARELDDDGALVLLGFGGGLVEGMAPGDVVVATSVGLVGSDDRIDLPDPTPLVDQLVARGLRAHAAPIVSSPKVLHGALARRSAARGGATSVDMESYWCAPLAATRPFFVCRVLLDVPGREIRSPRTVFGALRALSSLAAVARVVGALPSTTLIPQPLSEVGDR